MIPSDKMGSKAKVGRTGSESSGRCHHTKDVSLLGKPPESRAVGNPHQAEQGGLRQPQAGSLPEGDCSLHSGACPAVLRAPQPH